MKKLISFILAAVMSFACIAAAPFVNESTAEAADATNILVAYFSATGTTEGIAKHIQTILGADMYEIEAADPYTAADLNYNSDCRANREQNDPNARPEISGMVSNMSDYDVIFLGYPIWWGQAPKIIYTFLESYNFSGKMIIPFCTSASSGIGSSATNLHRLVNGAEWNSGRRFRGGSSQSTVKSWVDTITLPAPKPSATPVITISDTAVEVENAPENAALIMAFYKNSALKDVVMKGVNGTTTENITAKNADTLKVFLWDMEALKPLCNAEEKSIESAIDDNLVLIQGFSPK